jgi:predicted enzyme related to lactoylglutathione lyase
MASGFRTIIYPVKDLAKAKALYGALLGVAPEMDEPYYVGFRVGDQDIGLDPHGHSQGMTGPVGYYDVDDIKGSLELLLEAGAEVQ